MTRLAGPLVPVVSRSTSAIPAVISSPHGFRCATDDILFVANAHSYETDKVLNFIGNVASTAVVTSAAIEGVPIASAAGSWAWVGGSAQQRRCDLAAAFSPSRDPNPRQRPRDKRPLPKSRTLSI